jgi:hypothetical protein
MVCDTRVTSEQVRLLGIVMQTQMVLRSPPHALSAPPLLRRAFVIFYVNPLPFFTWGGT